jgi:hypothetical protein
MICCDVKWCDVVWCDVMRLDVMWNKRVPSACITVLGHFVYGCNVPVKQRFQTTNQGQGIGSSGRTRHRRTTKGRSVHNSSWVVDIGWQRRTVSVVLYIVTNGGTTTYRLHLYFRCRQQLWNLCGCWVLKYRELLTDVMTTGEKKIWLELTHCIDKPIGCVTLGRFLIRVSNCSCENDSKELERGWFTGQHFCCRLTAELTGASLEHDMFRFEFLQKKGSNYFYFQVRNSCRLFIFPKEKVSNYFYFQVRNSCRLFIFPKEKASNFYFSTWRSHRLFIFRREETIDFLFFDFFRTDEAIDYLFFGEKKPSTFYFPADFHVSTISQFQLKTTILTSFCLFARLHQAAYNWAVFVVCCSCPAQYGRVHTVICRPWSGE